MNRAQRVGAQANRLRFALWGGALGLLTLLLLWVSVSSDDQSYSVRGAGGGETSGRLSKHAYAYQGLARLLRSEGQGGRAVTGNSPLGTVGLRILLEPQLHPGGRQERAAFRDFLTASSAPVLLVPQVRSSMGRALRLDGRGFLKAELSKRRGRDTINAELGFERRISKAAGLVQGRLLGFDVAVGDLLSFSDVWDGSEHWSLDGQMLLYRKPVGGTPVYFLSDPDLLNNAGLGMAENAAATLALIDAIKRPGPVIFDNRDVRVGQTKGYSFIARLFDFPLALVSGSVLALCVLLFWLCFGRFGPMMRDERALAAGKTTALEAAVAMLAGTGNNREVLRRYLEAQTRHLAAQLGGPKTGDLARLQAWLDAVAERRALDPALRLVPVATLLNQDDSILSEGQAARAAQTIHGFRSAMTHDP